MRTLKRWWRKRMEKLIYFIIYKLMGINTKHMFVIISVNNGMMDYVGDLMFMCVLSDRGIKPELADKDHKVCSVGFSERDQKWYGWSHRAICGFKIGDVVKDGDCCASSGFTEEYLKEHPEENKSLPIGFTAKTLDDCRRMAVAFAESVS